MDMLKLDTSLYEHKEVLVRTEEEIWQRKLKATQGPITIRELFFSMDDALLRYNRLAFFVWRQVPETTEVLYGKVDKHCLHIETLTTEYRENLDSIYIRTKE